ncbi:WD40-repeat-containing domain protein [Kockovaella imperatae]|uniref:WD40-repeat-containing domain protein n=1 Tax=Kockovaella imperatae TaxID=4999 RepID=A0A1Y1UGL1_9TREE|nr:WD40-repeat-containing domain protein [Kockovaella imperatae]ORX37162.1 WD40-repeat-containing domain protein [Kockovaella imperatae]
MDSGGSSSSSTASQVRSKYGQPVTSSPRTLESNRRRLVGLFSSFSIGSSLDQSPSGQSQKSDDVIPAGQSESDSQQSGGSGTTLINKPWSWFHTATTSDKPMGESSRSATVRDSAVIVGTGHPSTDPSSPSRLLALPDEILVHILLHLDSSASELLNISLVCRHLHSLSKAPVLWYDLYTRSGFSLTPHALDHVAAVLDPPNGYWERDRWIRASSSPHNSADWSHTDTSAGKPLTLRRRLTDSPKFSPSPRKRREQTFAPSDELEIHYPTLFRSRLALQRQLHDSLTHIPSGLPHQHTLSSHTNAVYCLHLSLPYLFTGSRDRTMQLWRLPDPSSYDLPVLILSVDPAHGGSVLTMAFEPWEDRSGGLLVTGSSDQTAGVWTVDFGSTMGAVHDASVGEKRMASISRIATLRGCSRGVLGVALSKTKIVLSTKDPELLVYDRSSYNFLCKLQGHEKPINSLAINPWPGLEQVVSVSSDGHLIIWDLSTMKELRRGAGDGRGLACVAWEGRYILVGGNDRLVSLYDAGDASLIRTFEGNRDLVRAVSLDLSTGLVVSGGYDGSVRIWDLHSGSLIRNLTAGRAQDLVFAVKTHIGKVLFANREGVIQIVTYGSGLPYRDHFAS